MTSVNQPGPDLSAPFHDERALLARIADLEADVEIYRELTKAGIEALHLVTTDRDGLRARYHAALDELKALRSRVISGNNMGTGDAASNTGVPPDMSTNFTGGSGTSTGHADLTSSSPSSVLSADITGNKSGISTGCKPGRRAA